MDTRKHPSASAPDSDERRARYHEQLFGFVPLYTTRLVREGEVPYDERTKLSSPEDTAGALTLIVFVGWIVGITHARRARPMIERLISGES